MKTRKYSEARFLFEMTVVLSIAFKLGVKTESGRIEIARQLREKAGFYLV